jgi:uncharacterized membrane protein
LTKPSSAARLALLLSLALAACHADTENLPGGDGRQPYSGIAEGERLRFTGTEPFWGGEVTGGTLIYTTPEDQAGRAIEVSRFAGRGGLSFSGTFDGAPLVLVASEIACSDGMSDRTYPFTITLQVRGETRSGCGWTEARPFTGPDAP